MIELRFDQLAAVTGGRLYSTVAPDTTFRGVSIDSRTLTSGELFVAIRGVNQDGHAYIAQAIEHGASGIVTEFAYPEIERLSGTVPVVAVENTHEAMIALAMQYRHNVPAKFIGITGSNGKTTTKELTYNLIHAVEPTAYRSPGNLNNLYGVPLALFRIPQDCRAAVVEMGISTEVEMPRLVEIVQPDVAVITNVGATHLEFLGTIEAVAKAKLDLVRASNKNVPAIINADDKILIAEAKTVRDRFITFAIDSDADFRPDSFDTNADGTMMVTIEGHDFRMPLVGRHQVYNLLAAYAAFRTLGYSFKGVDTATIALDTAPMRGQMMTRRGIRFLVDCYNANPENVKAGLAGFFAIETKQRRVLVLGDMLELGDDSPTYHERVGRLLAQHEFDTALLVGPMSAHTLDGATAAGVDRDRLRHYATAEDCAAEIATYLRQGDLVYLKGSRGIGLEKILEHFDSPEKEN